jgi:uncharacterized protein (DUF1501 family)
MAQLDRELAASWQKLQAKLSRRALLQQVGTGIGSLAATALLAGDELHASQPADPLASKRDPLAPRRPHFAPRAKNVIDLHMVGAPSQLDLFDYKPVLQQHDGQLIPQEYIEGERFAFLRGHPRLLGTKVRFAKHGESGNEFSELLPHLATQADELAIVKSLHTELFNHAPAQLFFQTGFGRFGRPSLGSWITYGLGSENANLPAYVVMITGNVAGAGNALWGPGFLPSVYQGTEFRSEGDPVLFLSNPQGLETVDRRRTIDALSRLNHQQLAQVGDPEIETRVAQYELAFRMQSSVPELMDLSGEPASILQMYGAEPGKKSFANNCLLARRLVERGVRFVQLFDEGWDHHGSIFSALPKKCQQVDRATAALIADLKQRGLLDETLVLWGGEFGRTPMLQARGANPGRDHHKDAFTVLMAGGGVKSGVTVGQTDDLGYQITEDPIHVNDLHATLLHLLGLDHTRLTYKFQGRDFRLTDVAGQVVDKLLA